MLTVVRRVAEKITDVLLIALIKLFSVVFVCAFLAFWILVFVAVAVNVYNIFVLPLL